MNILAVDDSKAVHAFLKSLFSDTEHILNSVFDGNEALEYLNKNQKIDIILLDWEMPVMNGLDTLKAIRSSGSTVPIMMVTSRNALAQIAEALECGANEYVMKPFTKEILFEKFELISGV